MKEGVLSLSVRWTGQLRLICMQTQDFLRVPCTDWPSISLLQGAVRKGPNHLVLRLNKSGSLGIMLAGLMCSLVFPPDSMKSHFI